MPGLTIVQHKRGGPTGGSTTLSVTLDSATTSGNCLIITAGATAGTAGVTGITLGGGADNWHSDVHSRDTGGVVAVDIDIWSDPSCAGGQTAVVLSYPTTGSHSACDVWEVSPLLASLPADKSASAPGGSSTSYDSGPTATTSQASEFWVGAAVTISGSSGNPVLAGPGGSWVNQTQVNIGSLGSYVAGEQITTGTGAADYSGTIDRASFWAAAVVTYKAVVTASGTPLLVACFP